MTGRSKDGRRRVGRGSARAQAEWGAVTTESVLFEMILPLVFFLPFSLLSVRVSSDCAPLCRSLSSGWCRPQPSRRSCLAHAPPSGSPGEQKQRAHWWSITTRCSMMKADLLCSYSKLTSILIFFTNEKTEGVSNWCSDLFFMNKHFSSPLCDFIFVLTLSRPLPHNVIWVCLQPFPPVRPQTAGLYCFPFFTNTCSIPTWWPASLCRNDRHRLPSFQGEVRGRTSLAPRPVLLLFTSGMVRYRPPGERQTLQSVNVTPRNVRPCSAKVQHIHSPYNGLLYP